jgi:hypothetical protein
VLLVCNPAWNIKVGTTFLSKEQAQLMAEKDWFGSRRFIENFNKISKLLAKAGRSTSRPTDMKKFIQVPVAPKIEVKDFVKT